ncbi:hypothetical protein U2F26_26520 [Micromonospora sp. 4G57]|uniref:Serine/threonine protein kinase n=1 Tax=Micromonospora sicca TaxID=2202420 RepID=A0ABU5J738_9ACTN|nr:MULTISPECIES: hypothetical protein [unclassified Micromonospora]MDZ5446245.1 hypothetical protein [Micromonospora sp. 4G57]MDZ5488403.1 hypothetical protein [Micromonospora sp. 4G53]
MVYRYESDEDAFLEYPEPGYDLSVLGAGAPPPARPSPSRFPTPSLPPPARTVRPTRPPAAEASPSPARPAVDPAPARAAVPVPQSAPTQAPQPPASAPGIAPAATSDIATETPPTEVPDPSQPLDLPRSRHGDRKRGGGRTWQVLIGGAAVLMLLALCGLAAAALLQSRTATPQGAAPTGQPMAEQSAAPHDGPDLNSRDTDPLGLSAKEVFPGKALVVADGQPGYQVLKTHSSGSCAVAATGEVADLLVRLGCNQVVRATLRSPDGGHLLTAGLFNLTDLASAQRARDRIRQMLDERHGRLQGMSAGADTEAVANAAARVGWQVRGHYLAYCVVTRADGQRISADDAKVGEILYDMIEVHLNRGVLERRANAGVASQPTDAPTDGTAGQEGGRDVRESPGT